MGGRNAAEKIPLEWQHAALLPFPYYTKLPLALLVDGGLARYNVIK